MTASAAVTNAGQHAGGPRDTAAAQRTAGSWSWSWLAGAAVALALAALLVAFIDQVRLSVLQGERARAATAAHAAAVWHCRSLTGSRPRDECLLASTSL